MADPLAKYKYHKSCSLEQCQRHFETNRKNQTFCKPTHRLIYHDMKRRKTALLYKRMSKLERDLKQLYMEIDKALKKAVKDAGRMTVFLSPKSGGGNSTDTTKTKRNR